MDARNELQHWGIKGMRWGIRRYQNEDGSLTAAGHRRYKYQNPDGSLTDEGKKNYMKAARTGKLDASKLSDADLNMINTRFTRERTFNQNIDDYKKSTFKYKAQEAIINRIKGSGNDKGKGKGKGKDNNSIASILATPIKKAFIDAFADPSSYINKNQNKNGDKEKKDKNKGKDKDDKKDSQNNNDTSEENEYTEKGKVGYAWCSNNLPDNLAVKALRNEDVDRGRKYINPNHGIDADMQSINRFGITDATIKGTSYLNNLAEQRRSERRDAPEKERLQRKAERNARIQERQKREAERSKEQQERARKAQEEFDRFYAKQEQERLERLERQRQNEAEQRQKDWEHRKKTEKLVLTKNGWVFQSDIPVFKVRRIGSDELYHYGIKGQKWGIRRYQNEDGTLTDEGRVRYNKGHYDSEGRLTQKGYDNLDKLKNRYDKANTNYSKKSFKSPMLNKKDTERALKLIEKMGAAYEADPNKKQLSKINNMDNGIVELKKLGNEYLSKDESKELSVLADKLADKAAKNKLQVERLNEVRNEIGEKYRAATNEFISQMVSHDSELRDVVERKKVQDKIAKDEWDRISDQKYLDKIGRNKADPRSRNLIKNGDHYDFDGDGTEFWDMFADKRIQEDTYNIEREISRALRKSVEKTYSNVMNDKLSELKGRWHNDLGDDPLSELFNIGSQVVYQQNYGY